MLSKFKTLYIYPLFSNSFKRKDPYRSTIKCTQCYGAMRPSVAPCALRAQDAVHVLAMEPSSRPWLHGFSMLQTLYPLFSMAPGALHPQCAVRIVLKCIQTEHLYGSTINCTQCCEATESLEHMCGTKIAMKDRRCKRALVLP